MSRDPLRIAIHVSVYVVLFILSTTLFGWVLIETGYLVGITATHLLAAAFTNWLVLRIYENRSLVDLGLWWDRASSRNLLVGLAGGAGAASLVLLVPLAAGAARIVRTPDDQPGIGTLIFVLALLAAGAVGEELVFRGYGFQVLLAALGPYLTIVPVGIVFALLHGANPNASRIGIANTAGFGILFGYAYWRSRDLWLPFGLHVGWNFTLPLFGVPLSGLRMNVTGHEMSWTAGALWSGGEYGPEASVLTSGALLLLSLYLWKAPVRRQLSPLTGPPIGSTKCEPPQPLAS